MSESEFTELKNYQNVSAGNSGNPKILKILIQTIKKCKHQNLQNYSNKMNDTRFSKWVQVSGDKVIVYTQPKYFRIFAWVLCLISQPGLIIIVYANKQEPWLVLLWVPLAIILLFHATRKVVFNRTNRTFSVNIWGINFRKKTWQKMGSYSLGQKIIQYDHHRRHVPADQGYPLYLHFDADKVWITQGRQASELQQLAIALQEMLEAQV